MRVSLLGGAIVLVAGTANAGLMDPTLDDLLRASAPDDVVSGLVFLVDQLDADGITAQLDAERAKFDRRNQVVVGALHDIAQATQGDLIAYLDENRGAGGVSDYQAFWVTNAIRVDATPRTLRAIAARPDVEYVYYNYEIELVQPVDAKFDGKGPLTGGPEPGVIAVRAPEVWALGITGEGVLTSTLDTGVDGNHPALAVRWRGVADPRYAGHPLWAWYDPVTNTNFPQAFGSHGTHTMGSVCGGAPGNEVGVAPGAQWIHCATIDRISIQRTVSDSLAAFQWLLNPDGNQTTTWDVPRVCSNSWGLVTGHGYPPCDQTFWNVLNNCEAAGIVQLFSAGNEGTSGLRRPADRATDEYRTVAVAAVDGNNPNYPIAGFSSRGPTNCTPGGGPAIKPDIAAPGVNVRSAVPGGYGVLSGTSMASPHVNGVVCLMLEANPDLTVHETIDIIYATAQDLGTPGEDNSYGWGMIDAYDAVQEALLLVGLQFQYPNGRPGNIEPAGGSRVRVTVSGQKEQPEPGTGLLYYRIAAGDGGFTSIPMDEISDNVYDAVFPGGPCGAVMDWYVSAENTDGEEIVDPRGAPGVFYSAGIYSDLNILFEDDFEDDLGWTAVSDPGLEGQWERGEPSGDAGEPEEDADGSGQCYVTAINGFIPEDVDGGTTSLISPTLDASHPDSAIEYDRWYNNAEGPFPESDIMIIRASDDNGATWSIVEIVGPAGEEVHGGWYHKSYLVRDLSGIDNTATFKIRFDVSDGVPDSTVEAAIDHVKVSVLVCGEGLEGDVDEDGDVDFDDLLQVLAAWGNVPNCPPSIPEDIDGDCIVGFNDLLIVLANWTG